MEQNKEEPLYSSCQAAKLIGCSPASIRRAAKRLGLPRVGDRNFVVIRESDLAKLKKRIYAQSGNPNFWRRTSPPTREQIDL